MDGRESTVRLRFPQVAVMWRKAIQISFVAASSVGKCPRVLRILRRWACTLSSAFVV